MMIIDMKTATITSKGQIAIPKILRKKGLFKKGQKVALFAFKDRIELRPLNKISKLFETTLLSEKYLAKDWNK